MPNKPEPRHVAVERSSRWCVLDREEGIVTICRDRPTAEELAYQRRLDDACERLLRIVLEA